MRTERLGSFTLSVVYREGSERSYWQHILNKKGSRISTYASWLPRGKM